MVDIDFDLNQSHTVVQANLTDLFQDVINKYFQKTLLEPESVAFIANGKEVNPSASVQSHMNKLDKDKKKLKVLVNMIESNEAPEEVITESEEIICPQCKEHCRIAFEDFKIKLYECPNKHERKDINVSDFADTQKVNQSKIVCQQCNFKNKGNCPKNEFYRCLTCSKNICLLCKSNHDRKHNIIEYEQRNYICQTHKEPLIKYCNNCKVNICFDCEGHEEHESIFLGDLKPNLEEKKKVLNEMKTVIDSINSKIKEAINILNEFSNFMKKFYDISNTIVTNYNAKSRNYQILQNLKEVSANNILYTKLKDINTKGNINDIISMYRNIRKKENININNEIQKEYKAFSNEITIIYNIENKEEIKIFDDTFINNNKSKCNLIIDGQKKELCSRLKINQNQNKENLLIIKLQGIQNVINMSKMFSNCLSLISLPDISSWNTNNVTDMSGLFFSTSLKSTPDISGWNTSNVTNMSYMFGNCSTLKSLPDISSWNTINVTDMCYMFNYCKSLISLPDISSWNTNNVTNMRCMFCNCNSLTSLPDISGWNTSNVTNMSYMFGNCTSLKSLPDISSWKTKNVTEMCYMFSYCTSLISLPDISGWNTNNVTNIGSMFGNCTSLKSLPDISSWNTDNALRRFMFGNCKSLKSFPDISSWIINKDLNNYEIFEGVDNRIIPEKFKYLK